MKDIIYRNDAVALVIKAIHGTDNKEIQNYLMDGLRKQMWSLPSAEPTGDLISREDAIAFINSGISLDTDADRKYATEMLKMLGSIPSIEYSQGWIPITESEPNTADHVLVTYKWDDDDYETSELDYWVNKYEAEHGNERCKFFHNHIIAWQLKPKPYRETDFEWQKEE